MKLWAIIEAIKGLASMWKSIEKMYKDYMNSRLKKKIQKRQVHRSEITKQIETATKEGASDEKLKDLFRKLDDFDAK